MPLALPVQFSVSAESKEALAEPVAHLDFRYSRFASIRMREPFSPTDVWHAMTAAVSPQPQGRVTSKIAADILPPRLDDANFSYRTRNDQRWH